MRYSIRFKLFAALCGLIIFFVASSWALNSLFLEKYYFYNKNQALIDAFHTINRLYQGNQDELYLEIEKQENSKGLHIIILDKDFNVVYNSRAKGMEQRFRPFGRMFENPNMPEHLTRQKIQKVLNGETLIENRWDNRLNSHFISLYSLLSNKDYIFMSTPVAAIQESVENANHFFLITGILTIFVGSVFIFFITSRFTKPILELNHIAQRMAELDFSKRYTVKTRDEVGHLGESINSMSDQLEKSIMELKEANEILKKDIERERKIDEMRKEFITNVSHELKTPIALIQGYAEGLKVNIIEDEESKNYYCNVIEDEALKMNKLVRQLLDLSQIESGEVPLDRTDFDIIALVQQVLKRNVLVLNERNIAVSFSRVKEVMMVNADCDRIEQVFINYLNNAINHVNHSGIINIEVKIEEQKVRVSVYNSGEPIPGNSIHKIWTSFYKVDKARTRAYGGTGVGLSIVRAVQESHGNRYGVYNKDGGVEFWFEVDYVGE